MLVLIAEELSELWCSAAGGTPLYIHHDNDTVDTAKAYDFNNGIWKQFCNSNVFLKNTGIKNKIMPIILSKCDSLHFFLPYSACIIFGILRTQLPLKLYQTSLLLTLFIRKLLIFLFVRVIYISIFRFPSVVAKTTNHKKLQNFHFDSQYIKSFFP